MKNIIKYLCKIVFAICMTIILFFVQLYYDFTPEGILPVAPSEVFAANKFLSLEQALVLAKANSRKYRKTKSKISLQNVKYVQAVKSIQLKKKNMLTFRWSPLLNFHFPESPTLENEYNWIYKPLEIQAKISKLRHELNDIIYEIEEETSNLYVQLYTEQYKLEYYENRIKQLEDTLRINKVRFFAGTGKQSDIDYIQKQIDSANSSYGILYRKFEADKQKLSSIINIDIRVGYTFSNPYVEAKIERDLIQMLTLYTLDNSQAYYEVKIDAQSALTALNTNYGLMAKHYGNDINIISSYITTVKNGGTIDPDAFKGAYDYFLQKVDSYWNGKRRILFIKIPKEWFKGEVDGVRYIEDDPYILYTNALEYIEAKEEMEATEKEIRQNVTSSFDNLVLVRNTYEALVLETTKLKSDMEKAKTKNKLGEMSFEEYQETESLYQEVQLDMLDSLEMYTQTLKSFNRLTCGAVSKYLKEGFAVFDATSGGISQPDESEKNEITYQITNKIEDNIFELRIYVPDKYNISVSDYELWIDNVKIGNKTPSDDKLCHLTLTISDVQDAFIRFYDGDVFVADCYFDPYDSIGILSIPGRNVQDENDNIAGTEVSERKKVASYSIKINDNTNLLEIKITPMESEKISYYKVMSVNGKVLGKDMLIPVGQKFKYLSIIQDDMNSLQVQFFDSDKNELYTAMFNVIDLTLDVFE